MTGFSVRQLRVSHGQRAALDGVSIDLEPGQVHAVIGGDGAGKTTLLKVLAGLDLGQQGAVTIPAAERIGFVPSTGGIFAELTVAQNVEFVAAAYGLRNWTDRASMLLDRAAIGQFENRIAGAMSGGQQRKLAGCMALLHEPELLVLDEVTTGVDPVSRMELWRLIAGSAADGAAVVVATTYLDEAERMETVLLLDRGRTLAYGPPAEIIASTVGAVLTVDTPSDPARAWRSGRHWRQWIPDPTDPVSGDRLTLEDAAIVRELDDGVDAGRGPMTSGLRSSVATMRPESDTVPLSGRGVSKSFGDFLAVDAVDLDVGRGEIVALVGANGAGKTTAMKMLLGLMVPDGGTIRLFGQVATREQRRRIGYVPQNLGLYRDLTERENLEFRAQVFDAPLPDLGSSSDRLVRSEPLGAQRRLAFAAATQHGPDLLVLDEPTSGVSPLARSRLWDLIHANADAGVGVLVATHYMDEAMQADRIVVLSQGRLVAAGTVDEVLADRQIVEVQAERWALAFDLLDRPGRQLRLAGRTIRVLGERPDELRDELLDGGVSAEVRTMAATLEEVLIELDTAQRQALR